VIPYRPELGDLNTAIGRRLRLRRIHMALSLREVGDAVNVSFQQIQKYEQGECAISAARLWQLAGALGVTLNDLCPPVLNDDSIVAVRNARR
jgi:transcriptional regulator with XRE-family HTH domain